MPDTPHQPTGALASVGFLLDRLSAGVALIGGLVLVGIIGVSVVSIVGRSLLPPVAGLAGMNVLPWSIPGDIELVQHGTGVAVFSFLPFCQMRRGNVLVDFFTSNAPLRVRAALDALGNLIFSCLALLVAWRLVAGLEDKIAYQDTTMVLRLPEAYPFAFAVGCAWLLVAVCAFTTWRSVEEVVRGRPIAHADPAGN